MKVNKPAILEAPEEERVIPKKEEAERNDIETFGVFGGATPTPKQEDAVSRDSFPVVLLKNESPQK